MKQLELKPHRSRQFTSQQNSTCASPETSKSPKQESSGQVLLSFTLVRLPHQRTSRFLSPSAQDAERLNTVLLEGAKDTAKKLNFRLENRSSFTPKARRLICFI
ncbi:hypothetical protein F3P66_24620 (plasmid) [Agrobacterium fabrum]|uniref:Uncharacterized protein n=1 Tax=Agrobacterium fabrum (strain C58 / ATCC 33970) TaxID=176299 RepID=A8WFI2_AGRFC|nr:hypothetical protein Atu8060 [Agrobacterium fabrum str. C58]QRM62583.1 hypothetical protein F3P66_24620 [Agrobacterium fabrum]TRB22723.1 hypothetical protein EXN51_26070 [Agrobacterium fabrum]